METTNASPSSPVSFQLEREYAPSHVGFYVKRPKEITTLRGERLIATPACPVSDQPTTHRAARIWAESADESFLISDVEPNASFHIRIVSVETKHGRRTYKVVDDRNRLFEVKEDLIWDAIQSTGVNAFGELPEKYIWVFHRDKTRLVRESQKHTYEGLEELNLKVPERYEEGNVYRDSKGGLYLYLGSVTTSTWGWKDLRPTSKRLYNVAIDPQDISIIPLTSPKKTQIWANVIKNSMGNYVPDYPPRLVVSSRRYEVEQPDTSSLPKSASDYLSEYISILKAASDGSVNARINIKLAEEALDSLRVVV